MISRSSLMYFNSMYSWPLNHGLSSLYPLICRLFPVVNTTVFIVLPYWMIGLPWWLSGKESAYNAGDAGLIPGSGRSPGEGNGNSFQYSCLENPMDRGAWWAIVHGVAKSQTQLSNHHCHARWSVIGWTRGCVYRVESMDRGTKDTGLTTNYTWISTSRRVGTPNSYVVNGELYTENSIQKSLFILKKKKKLPHHSCKKIYLSIYPCL